MQYQKPFPLFNSAGSWIGFCLGNNVFSVDAVWRGWFPWNDSADLMTPRGNYLGTVVGNRLYAFEHKVAVRLMCNPSSPATPCLANRPNPVAPKNLPKGAADVALKSALPVTSPSATRTLVGVTPSVLVDSGLARKMPVRIRQNAAVNGCVRVGAIG